MKRIKIRPGLIPFLALGLALVMTFFLGCEDSGDGPGLSSEECQDLIAQGHQALEDVMWDLLTSEDPPDDISDIDFSGVYALYQEAIEGCPEGMSDEALFAGALTGMVTILQDPEVAAAFNEWAAYVDTATFFGFDLDSLMIPLSPAVLAPRPGVTPRLRIPLVGGDDLFHAGAGIARMAMQDPPQIEDIQYLMETEVIPRLGTAIDWFGMITDNPDFVFTITPRMMGDTTLIPLEVDNTEVYVLMAAMSVIKGLAEITVAYSFNISSYDSAGMYEMIQQDSDFLALRDGGGAHMGNALADVQAAVDWVEDAVDFLDGETDLQADDIIGGVLPLEPGVTDSIRDAVDDIRTTLTGPLDINEDIDGDGEIETFTIDVSAFMNDPVDNWKAVLPAYTAWVETYDYETFLAKRHPYFAPGMIVYCPVIEFEADTYADWIFPNPTLDGPALGTGGLLPGMTDAGLKELLEIEEGDFQKTIEFCEDLYPTVVTVEGYVWDASSYVPVVGATVGTDLDGETVVTDVLGHFYLETASPVDTYTDYEINASATGYNDYAETDAWGDHPEDINIYLSVLTSP